MSRGAAGITPNKANECTKQVQFSQLKVGDMMSDCRCLDPALAARDAARQAEMRFLCVAHDVVDEQESCDLLQAEAAWLNANDRFAQAVPTTCAGAIAKLQAVEDLLSDVPMPESSPEVRHLRAVVQFLEHQQPQWLGEGRTRSRPVNDSHPAASEEPHSGR